MTEKNLEVITSIERFRPQIVEGLLEDMYRNPFWDARYGQKGRIHSAKDTHYHIGKLIDAISLNLPSILIQYYHWVQGLLVYRGMCTLHLEQTIDSLGRQLAQHLPEEWPVIEPHHRASYEGLIYDAPACRVLQEKAPEIARAAAEQMFDPQRGYNLPDSQNHKAAYIQDNRYHLSYLADAVWVQSDDLFKNYVDWTKNTFLPSLGVDVALWTANLHVLAEEIQSALPAETASPFVHLLEKNIE